MKKTLLFLRAIKGWFVSMFILGLLVWAAIRLFRYTPSLVVTILIICVCLPPPVLALGFAWKMYRRRNPKKKSAPAPSSTKKPTLHEEWLKKIDWRWPASVAVSEVLILSVFHIWSWWENLWFVGFHLAAIVVFLFYREEDKKTKKMVVGPAGKLMLAALALSCVVNYYYRVEATDSDKTASSKIPTIHRILEANNPFGDGRPDEDSQMRAKVVKFWQDNLPDNVTEQERMVAIADEASHFNQLGFDQKSPLYRKVLGRTKVGVMGIDLKMWQEVGNGFNIADSAEDNLRTALYLYKTYRQLAWTKADKIHVSSGVIPVPAEGWTQYVRLSPNPNWHPSGPVSIKVEGSNVIYRDGPDKWVNLPAKTKAVSFSSASGKPEVVLLDN